MLLSSRSHGAKRLSFVLSAWHGKGPFALPVRNLCPDWIQRSQFSSKFEAAKEEKEDAEQEEDNESLSFDIEHKRVADKEEGFGPGLYVVATPIGTLPDPAGLVMQFLSWCCWERQPAGYNAEGFACVKEICTYMLWRHTNHQANAETLQDTARR